MQTFVRAYTRRDGFRWVELTPTGARRTADFLPLPQVDGWSDYVDGESFFIVLASIGGDEPGSWSVHIGNIPHAGDPFDVLVIVPAADDATARRIAAAALLASCGASSLFDDCAARLHASDHELFVGAMTDDLLRHAAEVTIDPGPSLFSVFVRDAEQERRNLARTLLLEDFVHDATIGLKPIAILTGARVPNRAIEDGARWVLGTVDPIIPSPQHERTFCVSLKTLIQQVLRGRASKPAASMADDLAKAFLTSAAAAFGRDIAHDIYAAIKKIWNGAEGGPHPQVRKPSELHVDTYLYRSGFAPMVEREVVEYAVASWLSSSATERLRVQRHVVSAVAGGAGSPVKEFVRAVYGREAETAPSRL